MKYVILIMDVAGSGPLRSSGAGPLGQYVKSYDPDIGNGVVTGEVEGTFDPSEALTFDSSEEAYDFYRRTSTTVPLRPDGKPNRPMTAFTIEVLPLQDAKPLNLRSKWTRRGRKQRGKS